MLCWGHNSRVKVGVGLTPLPRVGLNPLSGFGLITLSRCEYIRFYDDDDDCCWCFFKSWNPLLLLPDSSKLLYCILLPSNATGDYYNMDGISTVVWLNDSLVQTWTPGMAFKVLGGDFGQKTPWCWGVWAKRLLGADSVLAPRSHLARSPQHQGVFWPDQKSQKLKFQVSFLGLNIALSPNLVGSSDADFHKDSESGLN